jgi:hypothetical protein
VRVPRPPTEPGEEAQVDYGYLGGWLDPREGRMRRVWAFVMALAWSRHLFARPVLSLDARAWSAAHVAAFSFYGGVPARLVLDNLRTGVSRADLYDPRVNRAYAELAAHFGTLVDHPARARKPRDKPRVERPMAYVRDSFWAGREWTSEPHMQEGALTWCREVAGVRSHRGLEEAAPLALFEAVEGRPCCRYRGPVRAGGLVEPQGRSRLPRQGGRGPLLGALAPHREARRRSRGRAHRRGLRGRRRRQDLGPGDAGPPD